MGTSGAVELELELELERRESLGDGGLSSRSQLGTHWLIFGEELKMEEVCFWCLFALFNIMGKKRL